MATARDIVTDALQLIRVVGIGETAPAEYATLGLSVLNAMLQEWVAQGVNCAPPTFALGDTFALFVPPADATGAGMAAISYQGTWNAATNTPPLASSVGTLGHLYQVSTAGSTELDGEDEWSLGDYLIFDADEWRKGRSSARFERPVTLLLAVRLADYFGKDLTVTMVSQALTAWRGIQAAYVLVDPAEVDRVLINTQTRRYYGEEEI
jgi:hypothetical protein